ncbi:helix-turn-helix domain-containing protein [Malikia spinosa]|uniref:helix-turn-helix domain-containing protein n=1 Tax=Malikia spinosa TaxID=86180 RepID=UPI003FA1B824
MTEDSSPTSAPLPASAGLSEAAPPGELLRQAREAAGLQIASLAAMLKVPVERLQALEAGRYQELPNLTFARALASSVCRVLKIDPAPVLQGLPHGGEVKLGTDRPIQASSFDSHRRGLFRLPGGLHLGSPLLLSLLVLVLAVALWWWLPQRDADPGADAATAAQVGEAPLEPVVAEPPLPAVADSPAVVTPAAEPVPAAPAAVLPAPVAPAPAASAPVAAIPAAAAAAQPAVGQPLLQLRARSATWIQLKDGAGKELQQRTLQPGQTLDYDGAAPLQVVLGRASGVEVIVRGQVFDTSAYAPNKVARFEVK